MASKWFVASNRIGEKDGKSRRLFNQRSQILSRLSFSQSDPRLLRSSHTSARLPVLLSAPTSSPLPLSSLQAAQPAGLSSPPMLLDSDVSWLHVSCGSMWVLLLFIFVRSPTLLLSLSSL